MAKKYEELEAVETMADEEATEAVENTADEEVAKNTAPVSDDYLEELVEDLPLTTKKRHSSSTRNLRIGYKAAITLCKARAEALA